MSEWADFFDAQDEQREEWECGAHGPPTPKYGLVACTKPIDHDRPRIHRSEYARIVWRASEKERT